MSFEYAPVTKGFMMGYALTSIAVGVFDAKHYLHLQFVPHLSRHYQCWRLLTHHLAFSNSSDLLLAELLLYNTGVHIERQFGSVKFASFTIISTLISTLFEFASLVLFHRFGMNHIPPGPLAIVFSVMYQWYRLVPAAYRFRIFGVQLSNKAFIYVLALQLALGHVPGSLMSACIGLLVGYVYRSELINIKAWRVPPSIIRFSSRFLLPLIGSTRSQRRSNRARPERPEYTPELTNEEMVTTAHPSAQRTRTSEGPEGGSVVREWVNELTGRAEESSAPRIRVPTETEISQLTGMFPDTSREIIVATLQRSPNIETAVETLLTTSG